MTTAETTEMKFENNQISVNVHRKPASRVEFDMHVSKEIVEAAYKDAIREVAKEVSLPGFRKGRAPEPLVQKHFPSQIDQRWQELIASRAMQEGEKLTNISPLSRSSRVTYSMKKHNLEAGAHLSITFETEPVVPTIDPKVLELKKVERPVVDEKKIEETIRQVRFFFAKWDPVTGRGVEKGDFVVLNVDNIETTPHERVFSNTRFEVEEGRMAKWMMDAILGKQQGEAVEALSVVDDDATEEEKASYQPKKTVLSIEAILKAELPPLDDELAKRLGVNNVADLHEQIGKLLNKQADAHVQEKLRSQVSEQLLIKFPFDLPYTLVERETQFRLRHLLQDPQFQNYWGSLNEQARQNSIMSIFEQSQKAVRMFYLCRKIAEDAKLSVNPQDLPSAPNTALEALLQPSPQLLHGAEKEVQQAEAFSRLLLEKAEDYLIANATMC
jgi:trigger factor